MIASNPYGRLKSRQWFTASVILCDRIDDLINEDPINYSRGKITSFITKFY